MGAGKDARLAANTRDTPGHSASYSHIGQHPLEWYRKYVTHSECHTQVLSTLAWIGNHRAFALCCSVQLMSVSVL